MAKSLKEALLEQMATLQERGLAPGELPPEVEEQPSYANYDDYDRQFGGGGEGDGRRGGRGRAQRPRAGGARPAGPARMRETRETREPRRERREGRDQRERTDLPPELIPMPAAPPMRPSGPPRPMGPMGGPPGPRPGGPRPAPRPDRTDMLRRNAERIQREQVDRGEIQKVLAGYAAEEVDDAGIEQFLAQLGTETGALPPLHVVLEALRNAGSANPVEVGHQVRLHYRRPRARVAPAPVPVG